MSTENKVRLLWADDEMDLLKPHVYFLEAKGYSVKTVVSGQDAIDCCRESAYDLIFLDENMPGLSGLQTLSVIKEISPSTPVVMITKSEEESIMNQAIGSKIADYLIKPVNPNQILLSIKKHVHQSQIITEKATMDYQQEFGRIGALLNAAQTLDDWKEVYQKLVFWELELETSQTGMAELLRMQKIEANQAFGKFVKRNYETWLENRDEEVLLSPDILKRKVFPLLDKGEQVFFVLIDNFRLDQWKMVKDLLGDWFTIQEDLYLSILPTATQYARNAIFSGLLPNQIASMYPDFWVDEDEEEGKNLSEEPLIQAQLDRYRKKYSLAYHKVFETSYGERLLQLFSHGEQAQLTVVVLNFIDMLSHARTESKMIRELASTEAAYRSLTRSWFLHSSTMDLLKLMAEKGAKVILTTDHGTIRVNKAIKVVGDRNTNTNLRYKLGKTLSYNPKEVYELKYPEKAGLPSPNVSTRYIFALNNDFFAYPNNYNHYVSYYHNTFQHGGISLEEMMVPLVVMEPKIKNQ